MPVTLGYLNSGLVGDELHVFGNQFYLQNMAERYRTHAERLDLNTQTWAGFFPTRMKRSLTTATIDKNIYLIKGYHDTHEVFDPTDGSYGSFPMPYPIHNITWSSNAVCVMDNILFFYDTRYGLSWYDTAMKSWKDVSSSTLEEKEYYGKLALLWTDMPLWEMVNSMGVLWTDITWDEDSDSKDVWCTMITLHKDGTEIHGVVGPSKLVGTIPRNYRLSKSVSVIA